MYSDKAPFPRHDKTRREERLFDRGDAHGQRRRAYERKSRIFKRHRERMEKKPEKRILEILLGLEDVISPFLCFPFMNAFRNRSIKLNKKQRTFSKSSNKILNPMDLS